MVTKRQSINTTREEAWEREKALLRSLKISEMLFEDEVNYDSDEWFYKD